MNQTHTGPVTSRFAFIRFATLAAAFAMAAMSVVPADAANCVENRDFHQNLPTVIGREDQIGKFPFALNCDTVFVRKGVTTVVHPGTMLYFARPTLNSVIKVEGTLIIKGGKNSYVSLSGSLDSSRNGLEAGNRPWGGIEISEGGKMEYAGMMRAPTPITAFSFQVKIINSWFKGSSGMILPDGSMFPMDTKWMAINNMDFTKGNADRTVAESSRPADAISEKEKSDLLGKKEGRWSWKKAAVGAGALAVLGVGFAVLLAPEEEAKKTPPTVGPDPAKSVIDEFNAGYPTP
jgi:hypothetical protein